MKNISRLFIILVAVLSLAYILPDLYQTAVSKWKSPTMVKYSPVANNFIFTETDKNRQRKHYDALGWQYSEREYRNLMPFTYFQDLIAWGTYPEMVGGKYFPVEEVQGKTDSEGMTPLVYDFTMKRIKLFPLFETADNFTELTLPNEVFRINKRMEFISATENRIDEEKSKLFTEELVKKGFVFPARMIMGNPNTFKEYDFGYFVQDFKRKIFHIYQTEGKPVVIKTEIGDESGIYHITIKEKKGLDYDALLFANNGSFYQISKNGYEQKKIPFAEYNPFKQNLIYHMQPLNYEFTISGDKAEYYVLDRDTYKQVNFLSLAQVGKREGWRQNVYDSLFPFVIEKSSVKTDDGNIVINPSVRLKHALFVALILAVVCAFLGKAVFRKKTINSVLDTLIVAVCGIYGFLAVILLDITDGSNK